jgi:hypothetical protein
VPLAVRVPAEQSEWLARESTARNTERSALVREILETSRTCFGLPPADRDALEAEATRQRLDVRGFIGEVLREKARELRTSSSDVPNETATGIPVSAGSAPSTNGRAT